jgi:hypothetical protein
VHAEDQHRPKNRALQVAQRRGRAPASRSRYRHVPLDLAREIERFVAVSRLANYGGGGVVGEHLLETVTDYGVIVGYENSHGHLPVNAKSIGIRGPFRYHFSEIEQTCSAFSTGL